jgi:hypothetical protein
MIEDSLIYIIIRTASFWVLINIDIGVLYAVALWVVETVYSDNAIVHMLTICEVPRRTISNQIVRILEINKWRPWCLEDRLDWRSEREWLRPSPLPYRQSVDQTGESLQPTS